MKTIHEKFLAQCKRSTLISYYIIILYVPLNSGIWCPVPPLFTVTPKQTGSLPGDSLDVTWAEPLRDQSAYFRLIQFEAIIAWGAKARFAKWGGSDTLILSIGAQVPISNLQTGILISILFHFEVLKAVSFNTKCIISYSLLHKSKA